MNAHPATDSARITWKDALIIALLILYSWFAYDREESSHPPQRGSTTQAAS